MLVRAANKPARSFGATLIAPPLKSSFKGLSVVTTTSPTRCCLDGRKSKSLAEGRQHKGLGQIEQDHQLVISDITGEQNPVLQSELSHVFFDLPIARVKYIRLVIPNEQQERIGETGLSMQLAKSLHQQFQILVGTESADVGDKPRVWIKP